MDMKNIDLLKEQLSNNEEFGYDDLDFILDPNKNAIFYKYIKECGLTAMPKYAIKVHQEYFPRLFNYRIAAERFRNLGANNEGLDGREEAFMHITKLANSFIEEI